MVTLNEVTTDAQNRDNGPVHFDTPTRTRVRAITEFCQVKAPQVSQNDIFNHCNVSKQVGYAMLKEASPVRRHHNRPDIKEHRGRKPIFSQREWDILEDFVIEGGFEGRVCGYEEIVQEVLPYLYKEHPKLYIQTIRKAFEDRGYSKYTACQKPWLTKAALEQRRKLYYQFQHWTVKDWRRIRFSDEFHLGQGPKRKLKVIRKRGERYCRDCIQKNATAKQIKNRNTKRFHFWISAGYQHKSALYEYTTNSTNGKLTQEVYLNKILKGPVLQWIQRGDDFILEEDQDTGHGPGTDNPVRKWKEEQGLQFFFNASGSPDLSPIENIIRAVKQQINDFDHFEDETLHTAAFRAWDDVKQESINRYIDSMPQRIAELGKRDGDITQW